MISAALASLPASSTMPSWISVAPSKFRTPKISMMTSGRKRLKKTAARLRMNIFPLATNRAQSMPNRIGQSPSRSSWPVMSMKTSSRFASRSTRAFVKPRPMSASTRRCGVSSAMIRP